MNIHAAKQGMNRTFFIFMLALSLLLHLAGMVLVVLPRSDARPVAVPLSVDVGLNHEPLLTASRTAAVPAEKPENNADGSDLKEPESLPDADRAPETARTDEIELPSTPLGLGLSRGFFSSMAEGKSLRDEVKDYFFMIVESVNRSWWARSAELREPMRQEGIAEILIDRQGGVVSARMLGSTGSAQADRLIVRILESSSPLPPLPAAYPLDIFRAPLKIQPPSNLFSVYGKR